MRSQSDRRTGQTKNLWLGAVEQATEVMILLQPATSRLRTLRTTWRLTGSKANVKGKVGEMLSGLVACWAAVVRLVSWWRAVAVRLSGEES